MLQPTYRNVHFYELILKSYSRKKGIENPSCASFIDLIKFVDNNKPTGMIFEETKTSYIKLSDWEFNYEDKTCKLLLNKVHKSISDPTFTDFETKKSRKAGKKKTEGIEISSHVLIRFSDDNRSALAFMTMGSGISSEHLAKIFRDLISKVPKNKSSEKLFNFDDPSGEKVDGEPVKYNVYYGVSVVAFRNSFLENALETGTFQEMDVIATQQLNFDSGGNLHIESSSVKFKSSMPKAVTLSSLRNAIHELKRRFGDDGDVRAVKISYKLPQENDIKSTTLSINDLDSAFTRREKIIFKTNVEDQVNSIDKTVMDELLKIKIN